MAIGETGHSTQDPKGERFELRRLLGSGAQGMVYEAFDTAHGATVALKVLQRVEPHALFQFKAEFRALSNLTHPNLLQLFELTMARKPVTRLSRITIVSERRTIKASTPSVDMPCTVRWRRRSRRAPTAPAWRAMQRRCSGTGAMGKMPRAPLTTRCWPPREQSSRSRSAVPPICFRERCS